MDGANTLTQEVSLAEWRERAFCAFCCKPINRQWATEERRCPECHVALVNLSDIPHIRPVSGKDPSLAGARNVRETWPFVAPYC